MQAVDVVLCKLQKYRPVGTIGVAGCVLPEGNVAIDQTGVDFGHHTRAKIGFAQQLVNRSGRYRRQERSLGVDPTVAVGRAVR